MNVSFHQHSKLKNPELSLLIYILVLSNNYFIFIVTRFLDCNFGYLILGKKPYSCRECSFRTAYKDSLELHMNNVHGHGPRKVRTRQQQARVDGGAPENDLTTSFGGEIGDPMTEMMNGQVTVQDADGGMSVITVGEVGETVIVGGDVIHTVDAKDVQGVVEQMASGGRVHNVITTADGAQVVVESDQGQEETVTATEDLQQILVGIGAANVVQE